MNIHRTLSPSCYLLTPGGWQDLTSKTTIDLVSCNTLDSCDEGGACTKWAMGADDGKNCQEALSGELLSRTMWEKDFPLRYQEECVSETQKAVCEDGKLGPFSGSFTHENCQQLSCRLLQTDAERMFCENILQENSMIPHLTWGIDGDLCGHHTMVSECQYIVNLPDVAESHYLRRDSNYWRGEELNDLCSHQDRIQAYETSTIKVSNVDYIDTNWDRDCIDRDFWNSCVKWAYEVWFDCIYSREETVFSANENQCGRETDFSNPKKCAAAHQIDLERLESKLTEVDTFLQSIKGESDLLSNLDGLMNRLQENIDALASVAIESSEFQDIDNLIETIQQSPSSPEKTQLLEFLLGIKFLLAEINANRPQEVLEAELNKYEESSKNLKKRIAGKRLILELLERRKAELIDTKAEVIANY